MLIVQTLQAKLKHPITKSFSSHNGPEMRSSRTFVC